MTTLADVALFRGLRRRLALVIALVITGILALLVGGVILVLDRVLTDQLANALQTSALAEAGDLRSDSGEVRLRADPDDAGTLYLVWGPNGELLASTESSTAAAFAPSARAVAGGAGAATEVAVPGANGSVTFLVASEPVATASFTGVVQAARSLAPIRAAEERVTALLLIAAAGGIVLAAGAGWYLAGRSLRPAQDAFRRQREFTADASHELRTPLAVIDAGFQVLARHPDEPIGSQSPTLTAMRAQTARMTKLVGDLLTLARADAAPSPLATSPVDLDALVSETVAAFAPLAAERGATVEAGRIEGGSVPADHDRLAEALGALVHNALQHGGDRVHVVVGAWREVRHDREVAILEVRDDGPGIAPAERERLIERFARGDRARSNGGSGLGLAIARSVASAHGGRLELDAATPAALIPGLRARIELPAPRRPRPRAHAE